MVTPKGTTYTARWKATSTGGYTLHCGRHLGCRGFLGTTYDPEEEGEGRRRYGDFSREGIAALRAAQGEEFDLTGRWIVIDQRGYRRDASGTYHLLTGRRRGEQYFATGRRPTPPDLRATAPFLDKASNSHRVLGQFPLIPTTIACPECNALNKIVVPLDAELTALRAATPQRDGWVAWHGPIGPEEDRGLRDKAKRLGITADELFDRIVSEALAMGG